MRDVIDAYSDLGIRYIGDEGDLWANQMDRLDPRKGGAGGVVRIHDRICTKKHYPTGWQPALFTIPNGVSIICDTGGGEFFALPGAMSDQTGKPLGSTTCVVANRGAGAGGDTGIRLRGVTVDGNAANQVSSTVKQPNTHGLVLRGVLRYLVEDCTFKNTFGTDTTQNETFGFEGLQGCGVARGCRAFSDDGAPMSSGFSGDHGVYEWIENEVWNLLGQGFTTAFSIATRIGNKIGAGIGANAFNAEDCPVVQDIGNRAGGDVTALAMQPMNPLTGVKLGAALNGYKYDRCGDVRNRSYAGNHTQSGVKINSAKGRHVLEGTAEHCGRYGVESTGMSGAMIDVARLTNTGNTLGPVLLH